MGDLWKSKGRGEGEHIIYMGGEAAGANNYGESSDLISI